MLIIYGSLYPWHFVPAHLAANPLWILLHSWSLPSGRFFLRDIIVNVALYIPLGFAAHLEFRNRGKGPEAPFCASGFGAVRGFGIYGPVLLGLLLSTAMELMQLLEPSRNTSMADVTTNVIGSGIGVMAGLLFEAMAPRGFHTVTPARAVADRGAMLLIYCWVAWLVFPLFPVMSQFDLHRKLGVFAHAQVIEPLLLAWAAASWYAGGLLLAAAGIRSPRVAFALTLLAIPAQFFVVDRQPLPSLLLGAMAGVLLFAVRRRDGAPTKVEAGIFLAVIALRGLSPFHFAAGSTQFNWIPFGATLDGDWQSAARVLIEKILYYGTAVWLLRAAGVRPALSVMLVAAVLASIEIVQMHLPGRTPEITDPILAVLMGFLLAMLSRPASQSPKAVHQI